MMEKTFLLFGCGHDDLVRNAAINAVSNTFEKKGKTAVYFDSMVHIKPDALLYVTRSLFATKEVFTYYVTTVGGKSVCSFEM